MTREPTSEECNTNATIQYRGETYIAAWYPQMGGYVGKCWLLLHACYENSKDLKPDDGFDALVYHDGEFPFGDKAREPVRLHHCDPNQFIRFGELIQELAQSQRTDSKPAK